MASGVAPLPGWYLRGGEGRSATFALRDGDGALAGCTTLCVITRPGGADDGAVGAYGLTDSLGPGSWPLISTSDAARGAPPLRPCARARLHEET